jgi:hypothetical protein
VAYPDMSVVQATRDLPRSGIASNTSRAGRIRPARAWARSSESCAAVAVVVVAFGTDVLGLWLPLCGGAGVMTLLVKLEERGSKR